MAKRSKKKSMLTKMALDARSAVRTVWHKALDNKATALILTLQVITIFRIEAVNQRIIELGNGLAMGLTMMYMNLFLGLAEIAQATEQLLAIFAPKGGA